MDRLQPPSARRTGALVALRLRRLWRTRVVLLAVTLALLPVWATSPLDQRMALAAMTSALLTTVLVCGAGALADDLESGAALLLVLHDARPVERVLAESLAALVIVLLVALLAIGLVARALGLAEFRALVASMLWIAALVLSWTFLVVLLGCLLPGKGNALVMLVPLAAFALPPSALPLDAAPAWVASSVRLAWSLFPLQAHASAVIDALLENAPLPTVPAWVLALSPPLHLAAAVHVLSRVEPARRFTQ